VTLEREAKYVVDPDFEMPDLSAPGDGLRGHEIDTERFVSTYHDTADLRLVRWGGSLRMRTGQGWTVKLPHAADGVVLARREVVFEGSAGGPPPEAIDLVRGIVRGARLEPVARLETVRRRICLAAGEDARPVAEVVDDAVSVLDGRRVVDRFREIEVEFVDDVGPAAVAPVLVSIAAGAQRGEPMSKVARALGARATAAPDVVVPEVGPASTAGDRRFGRAVGRSRPRRATGRGSRRGAPGSRGDPPAPFAPAHVRLDARARLARRAPGGAAVAG
jgi:inorganic triphosphatase YgiF